MARWYHPSRSITFYPWIHQDAINFLESILKPDMTICEFGGGGSTLWLAKRVSRVITYENSIDWFGWIGKEAPNNVTLRFEDEPNNLFDACDLLFIDGEPIEKRKKWIEQAPHISSDWIVLDNANRPEYRDERERLKEYAELVCTVNGNEGGTFYLVTEFWRVK